MCLFNRRPDDRSVWPTCLARMLFAVAVIWMLLNLKDDPATAAEPPPIAEHPEIVIAGPNDLDDEEAARSTELLGLVTDGAPLKPREMPAYWQLLQWSQTASTAELDQRALHDVPFTQLCEQPAKYRGKLISMRLHVQRVLKYDAPSNPLELQDVYEAWGGTDESRSFPYVVVFSQCPDGLPIGTDIRGEVNFVGYFLKVMKNNAHGAPLLVGRVQLASPPIVPKKASLDPSVFWWILGGTGAVAGFSVWRAVRSKSAPKAVSLPDDVISLGVPDSSRGTANVNAIQVSSEFEQVDTTETRD
ncbi:MAG: hypothetical protein JWP89_643 [Schlesneria sp.]|nr:hypothetical protein [Schlesneria sp.]